MHKACQDGEKFRNNLKNMALRRRHLKKPISIQNILQGAGLAKRTGQCVTLYQIQKAWTEIVGEVLAEKTCPRKIQKAVLVISVENAAWAQHLTYMKEQILEAIQKQTRIKFRDLRFVNEPIHRILSQEKKKARPLFVKKETKEISSHKRDADLKTVLERVRTHSQELQKAYRENNR